MSTCAYTTDTRFGTAQEHAARLFDITGKTVLHEITTTEPIGPKKMFDVLLVAPCTGNTLAKLAAGIVDTPVCMAVKSHLRNQRPVVIAVSTNDALAGAAKNIGTLRNYRNFYFVPYSRTTGGKAVFHDIRFQQDTTDDRSGAFRRSDTADDHHCAVSTANLRNSEKLTYHYKMQWRYLDSDCIY